MIRLLSITLFLTIIHCSVFSQDMYFLAGALPGVDTRNSTLLKYNAKTCELEKVFEFKDELNSSGISPVSLSYHPDGRLYMISDNQLIAFNVLTRKIEKIFPLISIDNQAITLYESFAYLAISEEGQLLISEDNHGDEFINRFRYIDYDLRDNQSIRYYKSEDLFGLPDLNYPIGGFLKHNNLLFFGEGDNSDNKYPWDENSYNYWDVSTTKYDTVSLHNSKGYYFFSPSVYLPPCEPLQMLATGSYVSGPYNRLRNHEMIHINTADKSITEICPGQLFPDIDFPNPFWAVNGVANTTDFRQSPLRIDLDADNSSYHATAGYYDTLTTCSQEGPVMDDDIAISTCGAEVDYISFRLAYYDQPRLPEEFLTSEGFEEDLKQVSPTRWEWHNPYGGDKEKIKAFLRSLHYHADWDPDDAEESRERVVITTMHVGEDSTSSWTVFQLEQDQVYAGRDTVVEYCPASVSLDLRSFLSEDALAGGRFDPEPSGGGGLFVPGTDQDGEYLYIVESRGCTDTAEVTVQDIMVSDPGLDTVYLCPGGRVRIGFPPGKFSDIQWWDGSSGDSIWVEESADAMRQVNVTYDEQCGISITVNILIRESENLAGPDTTLSYCPAAPEIDLSTLLPEPPGSTTALKPTFQKGGLLFTPGTDLPGTYEYIVSSGAGCTDTARITLEESATKELSFEDVRLCAGQDARIGLPADTYQNVMWWNGETGDSTTVTASDTGPFSVEAQVDGCTFHADFDVIIQENIAFPDSYPDTLEICEGEPGEILVQEVDSIELEGSIFLPGDQILFSTPGDFLLTGFQNGCSSSKMIDVTIVPDPSGPYDKTIYWCESTPLTLTLPNDSAGLTFFWTDAYAGRERPVTSAGEYKVDIRSGNCTFQGSYTVIRNDDSECTDMEECTVSIPNAVTPNGDGINDNLKVYSNCNVRITEIRIFDKWGGELYSSQSQKIDEQIWKNLPPGVVMVQVTYETSQGLVKTVAGGVMVIK